jgi:hypothetical protein
MIPTDLSVAVRGVISVLLLHLHEKIRNAGEEICLVFTHRGGITWFPRELGFEIIPNMVVVAIDIVKIAIVLNGASDCGLRNVEYDRNFALVPRRICSEHSAYGPSLSIKSPNSSSVKWRCRRLW